MANEKSKKEEEILLHKLAKATTVREFVSLLGVEMYAQNTDEDNISLADLKLAKMKDLQVSMGRWGGGLYDWITDTPSPTPSPTFSRSASPSRML